MADGLARSLKWTTANRWRRIKQPDGGVPDKSYREVTGGSGSMGD
jgi:hypothetical protein